MKIVCIKCGVANKEDANFCKECGGKLEWFYRRKLVIFAIVVAVCIIAFIMHD